MEPIHGDVNSIKNSLDKFKQIEIDTKRYKNPNYFWAVYTTLSILGRITIVDKPLIFVNDFDTLYTAITQKHVDYLTEMHYGIDILCHSFAESENTFMGDFFKKNGLFKLPEVKEEKPKNKVVKTFDELMKEQGNN